MKVGILLFGLLVISTVLFAPLSADACYYGCGTSTMPHYGYSYSYQYGYNAAWANQWHGHWRRRMPARWQGYQHTGYWPYAYSYSY